MFFRKHPPPANPWTERKISTKDKETNNIAFIKHQIRYALSLVIFLSIWLLLLLFFSSPPLHNQTKIPPLHNERKITSKSPVPTCDGSLAVYVYELPPEFNLRLLKDCRHLNVYTDMCPHVANSGLGQPLPDMGSTSWFATHQFIAEMIFHARVENHPCRTWDPARANLFYVPFYGGLYASSKFREPNLTARDALAIKLVNYIQRQFWWQRHNGTDHFLVLGRTAWDFMRKITAGGSDIGANCLLNLPPVQNMSVLTGEKHPWQGSNQRAIPYPSYFHPSTSDEMLTWQDKVRHSERLYLFSFIGGPRKGLEKAAIRDEFIRQCGESSRCKLMKCGKGVSKCHEPREVIKVMMRSEFCLQAPGDSFTRRSTFDSVLAGCIPVFFSPHTAYSQYKWFFPSDPRTYSVYIDEKGNGSKRIEEELLRIGKESAERMRSRVIDLIPRITYMHPNSSGDYQFQDAVDVALAALSKHVTSKLQTHKR